jgi:hypothetical protein
MMEQMGGAGGMPDFGADDDGSDGEDAEDEAEGEVAADKGKGKAEVCLDDSFSGSKLTIRSQSLKMSSRLFSHSQRGRCHSMHRRRLQNLVLA